VPNVLTTDSAAKCSRKQVIRISYAEPNFNLQHPADIATSALALLSVNSRLESAVLALPDEAWVRIGTARTNGAKIDVDDAPYIGDLTAISLYRSFKGNWERGGRLYGGWWMNLPKAERSLITIDGEATAELDYSRLHPTLLFARQGLRLSFDPYAIAGYSGNAIRDMGKRTFGRLVNSWKSLEPLRRNRSLTGSNASVRLNASHEDKSALPAGITFPHYLDLLMAPLAPIAMWFQSDAGMTLQREDSDLAIRILERLDHSGIVALPVHDSFIVKQSEVAYLRRVMTECFYERYFFNPAIKPFEDHKQPGPTVP
jgi:hypothetical protein